MQVQLIGIGERMPAWVDAAVQEYGKRLQRELPVRLVEIPVGGRQRGSAADPSRRQVAEAAAMLAAVTPQAHVVALHGEGQRWSSEQLAAQLERWRMGGRDLTFVIGGADGHDESLLARADQSWSLGPLTLPHMLVRVLVMEQLYRAVSLLGNHPYHRG